MRTRHMKVSEKREISKCVLVFDYEYMNTAPLFGRKAWNWGVGFVVDGDFSKGSWY